MVSKIHSRLYYGLHCSKESCNIENAVPYIHFLPEQHVSVISMAQNEPFSASNTPFQSAEIPTNAIFPEIHCHPAQQY